MWKVLHFFFPCFLLTKFRQDNNLSYNMLHYVIVVTVLCKIPEDFFIYIWASLAITVSQTSESSLCHFWRWAHYQISVVHFPVLAFLERQVTVKRFLQILKQPILRFCSNERSHIAFSGFRIVSSSPWQRNAFASIPAWVRLSLKFVAKLRLRRVLLNTRRSL